MNRVCLLEEKCVFKSANKFYSYSKRESSLLESCASEEEWSLFPFAVLRVLVCRRSSVRESYSAKHSWISLALKNSSSKSRRSPAELVRPEESSFVRGVQEEQRYDYNNNNNGVGLLQLPINQRSSCRRNHRTNLQLNVMTGKSVDEYLSLLFFFMIGKQQASSILIGVLFK